MIIVGASASAFDISRDIACVAKEVHVADRSAPPPTCEKQPGYDNLWLHSMVIQLHFIYPGESLPLSNYKMFCFFLPEISYIYSSLYVIDWVAYISNEKLYPILPCIVGKLMLCRLTTHGRMEVWCSEMAAQSELMSSCTALGTVISIPRILFTMLQTKKIKARMPS